MSLTRDNDGLKSKGLCKLTIDEELTIFSVDALKQGLDEEIAIYEKFELNLEKIEEIDSAGIQLLLAFKHELEGKKKGLVITSMSSGVLNLLEQYGLQDNFS